MIVYVRSPALTGVPLSNGARRYLGLQSGTVQRRQIGLAINLCQRTHDLVKRILDPDDCVHQIGLPSARFYHSFAQLGAQLRDEGVNRRKEQLKYDYSGGVADLETPRPGLCFA